MKTNIVSSSAELIGADDIESHDLQIEANAKAFKELISGIYADKAYAIARETIANGFDSHVQAGCRERPLLIHVPTALEPHYSIRDYGVSMDHETVMTLYRTLFRSTKDDPNSEESNNYVGKFGLGSKSPFAYTDAFQVTTFLDGTVRYYDVFFNEGMPKIALLGSDTTDEENGVLVSFGVNPRDCADFERALSRSIEGLDVKPIFEGKEPRVYDRTIRAEGTSWKLLDQTQSGHAEARQGTVLYPLNFEAVIDCPAEFKPLFTAPFRFEFDIGELDVVTSREALSYDKRTSENIIARLTEVMAEIHAKIRDEISGSDTYWNFCKAVKGLRQTYQPAYFGKAVDDANPKFKGRKPMSDISVSVHNASEWKVEKDPLTGDDRRIATYRARFGDMTYCVYSPWDLRQKQCTSFVNNARRGMSYVKLDIDYELLVVIEDIREKNRYPQHRMQKVIDELRKSDKWGMTQIMWIRHAGTSDYAMRRLFAAFGRPAMTRINLLDVEYTPPKRNYTYGPRPKFKVLNDDGTFITPATPDNPPNKALYVFMRGGSIESADDLSASLSSDIRNAFSVLGEAKLPIVGIPATSRKLVEKMPEWKPFREYALAYLEIAFNLDRYIELSIKKAWHEKTDVAEIIEEIYDECDETQVKAAFDGSVIEEFYHHTAELGADLTDDDKAELAAYETIISAWKVLNAREVQKWRDEDTKLRLEWRAKKDAFVEAGGDADEFEEFVSVKRPVGAHVKFTDAADAAVTAYNTRTTELDKEVKGQFPLFDIFSKDRFEAGAHGAEVINYVFNKRLVEITEDLDEADVA